MHEETLRIRLKSLSKDLSISSEEANLLLGLLTDSVDDKEELLKHLYFSENSPVKVLNTVSEPHGQGDITEEVIDVCMGYDKYVKSLGREAYNLLDKHNKALRLFIDLITLPYPYSQILYLKDYKKLTVDEICVEMYLSKSSFYRKYERSFTLLLEKVNS